jgi:hypothetical protein
VQNKINCARYLLDQDVDVMLVNVQGEDGRVPRAPRREASR